MVQEAEQMTELTPIWRQKYVTFDEELGRGYDQQELLCEQIPLCFIVVFTAILGIALFVIVLIMTIRYW